MTADQAERMLEGLAEQELDNLREQALSRKPAPSRSPEIDW